MNRIYESMLTFWDIYIADYGLVTHVLECHSQKIPRTFYLVQELLGLQRVHTHRELSQRKGNGGHCNGD